MILAFAIAFVFALRALHVFASVSWIWMARLRATRFVLLLLLVVRHRRLLRGCPPVLRQRLKPPVVPAKIYVMSESYAGIV